jgi:phosphatidylglycerol:prolipoprotein diacylglycerol transferase
MQPLPILTELRFPRVDPVLLDLPGPVDVRWYGVMYLVGFAAAYVALRHLARRGELRLPAASVGDLLATLALGVLIGGRLGYLLFYGLAEVRAEPLEALRFWEGGMSFHGGLLGVVVAGAWYARRHHLAFTHLADALALATPFGLFAVRVANFVNGELYGRVASADVPWAVRFPTDPVALAQLGATRLPLRERELRLLVAFDSGAWDAIRPSVPLRHPSQLYEALGEGVLLALLLWVTLWSRRRRAAPHVAHERLDGTFAGLFLVGYGTIRSTVELFRQPDAQFRGADDPLGTVLGPLTMGQVLSGAMVVAGIVLLLHARIRSVPPEAPTSHSP